MPESAVSMLASTFWLSRTNACFVLPAETAGQRTEGSSKKSAPTSPAAAFVSQKKRLPGRRTHASSA